MRCLFTTPAHLHARTELAALRLRGKNADLRLRQIFQDDLRHVGQGTLGIFFENEDSVFRAHFFHFLLKRSGDVACRLVGDNRDAFFGFETQANADGVARAGLEFRIDG